VLKKQAQLEPEPASKGPSSDENTGTPDTEGHDKIANDIDIDNADDAGPTVDPLLECVTHIAKRHYFDLTSHGIVDGTGLAGEPISPAHLNIIGERTGLSFSIARNAVSKLSGHDLPVIVLTKNRGAWVLHQMQEDTVSVFMPTHGSEIVSIPKQMFDNMVTGDVIHAFPSDESGANSATGNRLYRGHWFWGVISELRGEYTKVILASFLVNSLAIAAPLFTLNVYDRVLPNSAFSTLWVLAIGMGIVLVFDLIFRALRGAIIDSNGRWADVKLASRIFDHVLRMKMADKPAASGAFANRLRDFETVRDFFSSASLLAIVDILFVVLFLGIIYMVGGPLIYIPAAAVVIVLIAGVIIQPLMMNSVRAVQEESAHKHSLLIEAITGLDAIKTLNAEDVFLKKWQNLVAKTARSTESVRGMSLNIINFTLIVQQTVTVGLIIGGTYLFDQGEISMGGIIATVMLASRAVSPLGTVASTLSRFQQSIVSLRNLNDIMKTDLENDEAALQISREISRGDIVFENVTFAYPDTVKPALNDASFVIRKGDRVGIIGRVGSGKSTLAQILAGLYRPEGGSVSIDGVNATQLHTSDLRKALGYVQQDIVLFSGTIKENIALGKPLASDNDIVKAAELSGAASFINSHPLGYGMNVGERGRFLSGGQRQFIALARALINDPAILLLDEPTSAMDHLSEALFMQRLNECAKGKTMIISTHRQSLLRLVDKIMLIDDGRVVAFGPKAKVLELLNSRTDQTSQLMQVPASEVRKPSVRKSGPQKILKPVKKQSLPDRSKL